MGISLILLIDGKVTQRTSFVKTEQKVPVGKEVFMITPYERKKTSKERQNILQIIRYGLASSKNGTIIHFHGTGGCRLKKAGTVACPTFPIGVKLIGRS
jgi:hypothetical protein